MERYGNAVWAGCLSAAKNEQGDYYAYFTVGDVSKAAGVSKNTARKYLEYLYENGNIKRLKTPRVTLYRLIAIYDDGRMVGIVGSEAYHE
jgi:predicted transcriptional regulator of viral defense system